ncbi:MAG: selenocysteine-specific translation elongation factor [Spirochaetaceae bacterium]|nr:selenocysteine-specific translation elongation factor [Spirochaetaceae bacterium]
MHKIIGTAGHVDHGKSALIKALTGCEQMRLPEERARGMTIDLGFSHFTAEGLTVGVIDVPGHERFIRNMVAGMWSLNLVMLVVAADEGFMPMTYQHSLVALSLGLPTICVLNKIDLLDAESLELQELLVKEELFNIFKQDIEIVKVSTLTGEGITGLKEKLTAILNLQTLNSQLSTLSYLYIDRVFSIQGAGLTVTGSLAAGNLTKEETLNHFPSGEKLAIRGIGQYHHEVTAAIATTRLALNLKGIKREAIKRGDLLTNFAAGEEVLTAVEVVLAIDEIFNDNLFKAKNIELAVGTNCQIARLIPLYKQEGDKFAIVKNLVRLRFTEPQSFFWRQKAIIISHGGSTILAAASLFWAGATGSHHRKKLALLAGKHFNSHNELQLAVAGYLKAYKPLDNAVKIGPFYADNNYLNNLLTTIKTDLTGSSLNFDKFKTAFKLEQNFAEALSDYLIKEKIMMVVAGNYKLYSEKAAITLTAAQHKLEQKLKEAALVGLHERDLTNVKDIKTLNTAGLAVYLDEGLYYHPASYAKAKEVILKGKTAGELVTIAEVKDGLGLSRKYVIPLLNAMEREGLLKRQGNERVVL